MHMKSLLLAAAMLAPIGAAVAQQEEQVTLQIAVPPIPCATGTSAFLQNKVLYLENFTDGILPDPLYITKNVIWFDGVGPVDSSTIGAITVAVDPGQKYIQAAGFPSAQRFEPQYLKPLGILELRNVGVRRFSEDYNPPVAYRSGDAVIIAPYCTGGAPGSVMTSLFLAVNYKATADIPNPPTSAPPHQLLVGHFDTVSSGNPASSVRSVVPGPVVAASKFRAGSPTPGWAHKVRRFPTRRLIGCRSACRPAIAQAARRSRSS